jgi:Protein of unknown function (DUF3141)
VVIASWGDNITPPPQARNWIPDLYESVDELVAHEQLIIYTLDQRIGHLGIFVSAKVAEKQQAEIVNTIDLIGSLPPGLHDMIIEEKRQLPKLFGLAAVDGDSMQLLPSMRSCALAMSSVSRLGTSSSVKPRSRNGGRSAHSLGRGKWHRHWSCDRAGQAGVRCVLYRISGARRRVAGPGGLCAAARGEDRQDTRSPALKPIAGDRKSWGRRSGGALFVFVGTKWVEPVRFL